jgi:type II secretory pathway component GspD/PulD (secretin)
VSEDKHQTIERFCPGAGAEEILSAHSSERQRELTTGPGGQQHGTIEPRSNRHGTGHDHRRGKAKRALAFLIFTLKSAVRVERALRDFDRPRLQVAIEATVAEVTLTNELAYGVQYFLSGIAHLTRGGRNAGPLFHAAIPHLDNQSPQAINSILNNLLGGVNE